MTKLTWARSAAPRRVDRVSLNASRASQTRGKQRKIGTVTGASDPDENFTPAAGSALGGVRISMAAAPLASWTSESRKRICFRVLSTAWKTRLQRSEEHTSDI